MLEWLRENWVNLLGLLSFVLTLVGLGIAFVQVKKARTAAEAASEAAKATQEALSKSLTIGDLKNAIALLEKVKSYHRADKWEVAIEWYQPIRAALADARARYPGLAQEQTRQINAGIAHIREMGNVVEQALRSGLLPPANVSGIAERLNAVQSSLESLVSDLQMTQSRPRG